MSGAAENLYSVREVARIFALHESRIRYWAQTGFINPSGSREGRRGYTFGDLVAIKAAKELLDRGIPLQRVRRNLQALRESLPQLEQPLTQLRVFSDGEHLVVGSREHVFDPVSKQLLLDFAVDELRSSVAQVLEMRVEGAPAAAAGCPSPGEGAGLAIQNAAAGGPTEGAEPTTALAWFRRGCTSDGEDGDPAAALQAYERAVELDPSFAPAHTNMGNLHYRCGDLERARRCYETACTLDPDQPEARYNLGNLYEEIGELDLAIAEQRCALRANPEFVDAHFNLALTLERVGSRVQALTHWQRYLELAARVGEAAEWVAIAREHLAQLGEDSGEGEPATRVDQETTSSGS